MTEKEIVKHINDGGIFYLKFFGDAEHMELHDNGFYSYIKPKNGEFGVSFVFDIRIKNLSAEKQAEITNEIKSLNMPVWWNLEASGKFNKDTPEPPEGDEIYWAIFPDEQVKAEPQPGVTVKKVTNQKEFEEWVSLAIGGEDGHTWVHPQNHYHLCEKGIINCFWCYKDNALVSFASYLDNNKISSLEFVSTMPEYRRQGLAKIVCCAAIKDAFDNGSKIVTLRSSNPGTRELYKSVGFTIYNYAM